MLIIVYLSAYHKELSNCSTYVPQDRKLAQQARAFTPCRVLMCQLVDCLIFAVDERIAAWTPILGNTRRIACPLHRLLEPSRRSGHLGVAASASSGTSGAFH